MNSGFRYVGLLREAVEQEISQANQPIFAWQETQKPKGIRTVLPLYPMDARLAHIQGAVLLHAIIGKNGDVRDVTYVSGPPPLAQPSIDAVKQWKYKPTLLNGKPVEVETCITMTFTLGR